MENIMAHTILKTDDIDKAQYEYAHSMNMLHKLKSERALSQTYYQASKLVSKINAVMLHKHDDTNYHKNRYEYAKLNNDNFDFGNEIKRRDVFVKNLETTMQYNELKLYPDKFYPDKMFKLAKILGEQYYPTTKELAEAEQKAYYQSIKVVKPRELDKHKHQLKSLETKYLSYEGIEEIIEDLEKNYHDKLDF